uniref:Uncharacterized protein n=1 Tax=Oryza punctata TaxID=4537 RepID=A0A0E0M5Q1_ORYPU
QVHATVGLGSTPQAHHRVALASASTRLALSRFRLDLPRPPLAIAGGGSARPPPRAIAGGGGTRPPPLVSTWTPASFYQALPAESWYLLAKYVIKPSIERSLPLPFQFCFGKNWGFN